MLCLADRGFFGFPLWRLASGTGAMLLWRVRKDMRLPCEKRLPDGSYLSLTGPLYGGLSRTYPSQPDQKRGSNGVVDQSRSGMNNLSGDKVTCAAAPVVT
jgi:hypothetical protein